MKEPVFLCPIFLNFDQKHPAGAVYLQDGKMMAQFAPEVAKELWEDLNFSVGVRFIPNEKQEIGQAEIQCFSASIPHKHGPNCGCHYCT